jgi:signal transduction histidine kinase/CheY-like chemotaxis protein
MDHYKDSQLTLLTRFYRVFLLTTLMLLVIGVPFVFLRKAAVAALLLVLIGAIAYCWLVARRGELKKSLLLFAAQLWVVLAILLYFGSSAASMGIILPVSVLLAVIVSRKAALIYGFGFLLLWSVYVLLVQFKLEPPRFFNPSMTVTWFVYCICFWLTLMPISSLISEMQTWIRKAEDDAERRLVVEAELRTAVDTAVAAAAAKGRFLANMSHEIRTPMNGILGLLKLLQITELTARQRDYSTKIDIAARSLLALLNDILDFSKAESGKMELAPEPFRLEQMLRNLSVILAANLDGRDIDLIFDIAPDLPPLICGDQLRLDQILTNLCTNAIKFTPRGQVVVALRKKADTADTVSIEFSVQDSGIGIAQENQSHIFSGFSQAEATTTRRFGGTGLGLAICRHLVELMGGQLQLDSSLGLGSTFSFQLDFPQVVDTQDVVSTLPSAQSPGGPMLVVCNNAVAGALIQSGIQSPGSSVTLVASGRQALDLIMAGLSKTGVVFPYPVILLDCQIPDMDAWQTTLGIRELVQHRNLIQPTIILMSSDGGEQMILNAEIDAHPLTGFVVKPVTPAMLWDTVAAAQIVQPHVSMPTPQAKPLSGLRILVVEDNLINQQVAQELLWHAGAEVALASNGQLGIDAVAGAQRQFDVVLMDIQMPVLDGYAATQYIRKQLGLKDLPIIAISANALASDRSECLAAGMTDHIGKPFDMAQLIRVVLCATGPAPNP